MQHLNTESSGMQPSARILDSALYLHHLMLHLVAIASISAVCVALLWRYARGLVTSTMRRQATTAQFVDGEMQAVEEEGGGEPGELVLNHVQHIQAREDCDEMNCIVPTQENDPEATHIMLVI